MSYEDQMREKAKEGTLKSNGADAPKKRKRWDQNEVPKKKLAVVEDCATPAASTRWDETPGRQKGSETPGEFFSL